MSLGVHRNFLQKAMAAGSSNGCLKVSSKSSGGSIKAMRKKRAPVGSRRERVMRRRAGGTKEEFCMSDYLEHGRDSL